MTMPFEHLSNPMMHIYDTHHDLNPQPKSIFPSLSPSIAGIPYRWQGLYYRFEQIFIHREKDLRFSAKTSINPHFSQVFVARRQSDQRRCACGCRISSHRVLSDAAVSAM